MNAPYSLDAMLTALTAAGYYVSFTQEPAGYVASVSRAAEGDGDRYEHDATGATLAGALAAALPEAVEAYLAAMTPPALPAPAVEDDVRTLSADMADVFGRLNALEDHRDKFDHVEREMVLVIIELLTDRNPRGELARRLKARGTAAGRPLAAVDGNDN